MIGREARSEETSALGTIFYFVGDGITGNQLSNLLTQQIWRSDLARPYDMSIKVDIRRTKPYESCGWLLCTTNINDNKGWQQRLTTKADNKGRHLCHLYLVSKVQGRWYLSFPSFNIYSVELSTIKVILRPSEQPLLMTTRAIADANADVLAKMYTFVIPYLHTILESVNLPTPVEETTTIKGPTF